MARKTNLKHAWMHTDTNDQDVLVTVSVPAEFDGDGWAYLPSLTFKSGLMRVEIEFDERGMRNLAENMLAAADRIKEHRRERQEDG